MHMKKKGVVLLITLFFITAISVLILKNLDDSEKFIDEVSQDVSLTQINITNKNVQAEVIKLVNSYQDNIDELLEIASAGVPFEYGNIKLFVNIEEMILGDCDINKIKNQEDLYSICSDAITQHISYPYDFVEQLNKIKSANGFKNQKQIEFFLQKYQNITKDEKIMDIKDSFGFMNISSDSGDNRYIKCSFDIDVDNIKAKNSFVFKVGSEDLKSFDLVLTN